MPIPTISRAAGHVMAKLEPVAAKTSQPALWRKILGYGLMAGFGGPAGQELMFNMLSQDQAENQSNQMQNPVMESPSLPWKAGAAVSTPPFVPEAGAGMAAKRYLLPWGGRRQYGGYVRPDRVYTVGERGPELFVPHQPGVIIPSQAPEAAPTPQPDIPPAAYPSLPTSAPSVPAPEYSGGGTGSASLPVPPSTEPSGPPPGFPLPALVRKREQDLLAAEQAPIQRQPKFWNRLGSGILDGLRAWTQAGAPGGLAGALGAIATGGTIFAASPRAQAEYQKFQDIQEKQKAYGAALNIEQAQKQKQVGELKEMALKRDMALKDPVFDKGFLTPNDLSYLKKTYNVDFTNPDNPRFFNTVVINGSYYVLRPDPKSGVVVAIKIPGAPPSVAESPVMVQTPQGPLYLPPKAAYGVAKDAETMDFRRKRFEWEQRVAFWTNALKEWEAKMKYEEAKRTAGKDQEKASQAAASYDYYKNKGDIARAEYNRLVNAAQNLIDQGVPVEDPHVKRLLDDAYKRAQEVIDYYEKARASASRMSGSSEPPQFPSPPRLDSFLGPNRGRGRQADDPFRKQLNRVREFRRQ